MPFWRVAVDRGYIMQDRYLILPAVEDRPGAGSLFCGETALCLETCRTAARIVLHNPAVCRATRKVDRIHNSARRRRALHSTVWYTLTLDACEVGHALGLPLEWSTESVPKVNAGRFLRLRRICRHLFVVDKSSRRHNPL